MHLPGASVTLSLTLLLCKFGYVSLNLIDRFRKTDSIFCRTYLIFKFITFFILTAGFILKIFHWPGGSLLRTIGNYALSGYLHFYLCLRFRKEGTIPFYFDDQFTKLNSGIESANRPIYSSLDSLSLDEDLVFFESIRATSSISKEME